MQSRVQMWGNSLAVRIPKAFAAELGLAREQEVELKVEDGALTVRPAVTPHYHLDGLLALVSDDNLHDPADWGDPTGREEW